MSIHKEDIYILTLIIIQEAVNVCSGPRYPSFFIDLIYTEQQITLYPHRDQNNDWVIYNVSTEGTALDSPGPLAYITPGMRIKLRHSATEKHLHSHDIRPPVSDVEFQNEVSAYGMAGFAGDANDDWFVEIERGDKRDKESSKRLRTLRTQFRLRHALTGCYLFSHKVKLPEWGFEQQEVTCNKNAPRPNSLWFVETNTHKARMFKSGTSSAFVDLYPR